MGLSKLILNIALWIVNICTFFVRQNPNRITFVSLTQDTLTSDFKYLAKALEDTHQYEIHYNLIKFEKNLKGDFQYFLNCLKQLVQYKRSKLVILNDNNYVISHCKPKHTKVLQVWHACGAIKKFGNQIKRQYPIQNYDAVICNAEYWKTVYDQAFGVNPNQVKVTGMPRVDALLKEDHTQEFFKKYPECRNKTLVLYAPTFRGNIIDGLKVESFDIKKVCEQISDDMMILYKFHPLLEDIQFDCSKAIDVKKEDLYTLMQVSSCLISDYSSVILDYSLLDKPMIGYISDVQEYSDTIGLNVEYEKDFPGDICFNEEQLIHSLQNLSLDFGKNNGFKEKYMGGIHGSCTQNTVDLVNIMMKA